MLSWQKRIEKESIIYIYKLCGCAATRKSSEEMLASQGLQNLIVKERINLCFVPRDSLRKVPRSALKQQKRAFETFGDVSCRFSYDVLFL